MFNIDTIQRARETARTSTLNRRSQVALASALVGQQRTSPEVVSFSGKIGSLTGINGITARNFSGRTVSVSSSEFLDLIDVVNHRARQVVGAQTGDEVAFRFSPNTTEGEPFATLAIRRGGEIVVSDTINLAEFAQRTHVRV